MIEALKALYINHATVITYMLQSTEYQVWPYLKWYWRTQNFAAVIKRRTLDRTTKARLLLIALRAGMAAQIAIGTALLIFGVTTQYREAIPFGAALILSYPIVWAHLIVIPLLIARKVYVVPNERKIIKESEALFANHPAIKIAVVGSYGKTTMKEILTTVLSKGKKVAATPANKNVAISHARFIQRLDGDEEVLILEYGEGAPGDVRRFSETTHPTHAVITGLAPAHLDQYKTLAAAASDIFSVAEYTPMEHVYVNLESSFINDYIKPSFVTYSHEGMGEWRATIIKNTIEGIEFILQKGQSKLTLQSSLLGRHQIGPLSVAAVLGLEMGLTHEEIRSGISETSPFEHRMQPYRLSGAWIIDDTYNGNLEGVRAGTELLKEYAAKRKWYVTPGLVDQGSDTAAIHEQVGELIADAKPDFVVLMQNSVTQYIRKGLENNRFSGEIRIETDPLNFYMNLEHFVGHGDLVLMQNDWTDNYA